MALVCSFVLSCDNRESSAAPGGVTGEWEWEWDCGGVWFTLEVCLLFGGKDLLMVDSFNNSEKERDQFFGVKIFHCSGGE